MATYGITIALTAENFEKLKEIQSHLESIGVQAKEAQTQISSSTSSMHSDFTRLRDTIIAAFAIDRIKDFAIEIANVTAEFEGFENRIKFASINSGDAAQNMQFLREEVQKLHLPIKDVYQGFSEMEAGLRGTGIEGQRLRDLFNGLSTAASTLHLDNYSLQRTLLDFKEIGEIGLNMRIYRSLGTAFPGINKVIQETFGKSFHDLEKEKLPGSEFLAKIGPALEKEYRTGLDNWGKSLQAKMNDTKNAFYAQTVDLGEKLKPVFISVMNEIISGMEHVKRFVDYLYQNRDTLIKIAEAVRGLVIAFVLYKSTMLAVNAINMLATIRFQGMNIVMGQATAATEGMTAATEGLSISLASLGWGALAIGIGLVIEKLMEMNDEFEKTQESLFHIKEFTATFNQEGKSYDEIFSAASNLSNLNTSQKGELLGRSNELFKQLSDETTMKLQPQINSLTAQMNHTTAGHWFEDVDAKTGMPYRQFVEAPYHMELREKLEATQKLYNQDQGRMGMLMNLSDKLGGMGVKTSDVYQGGGSAMSAGASSLSEMGGAHGGLGQAKVIKIDIHNMQNIEEVKDGRDVVSRAPDAVQAMLRVLNNISFNQSVTM